MAWQNVDLFEYEASWFSDELRSVIVPLVEQAHEILMKWEHERNSLRDQMLNDAKTEEDEYFARQTHDQEDYRNAQRAQVLGAAALHYLYSALKTGARDLNRYFDKTHPPRTAGYKGRGLPAKLREEYADRFRIDVEKLPCFESTIELTLARNAGIHLGRDTLREYTEKVKSPRFCEHGEFFFERKRFMELLGEVETFFVALVDSLVPIRRAKVSSPKSAPL